jgi:hypothetical protein
MDSLTRKDFRKDKRTGNWISSDGNYRLKNMGTSECAGWHRWHIEKHDGNSWRWIACGPSMTFLIETKTKNTTIYRPKEPRQ